MQVYQSAFFELALKYQVLKFGSFKLKSGRISPYFFNLGQIADGVAMRALGGIYADALIASGLEFDLLFGPAYKGIPLVTAVAMSLAERGIEAAYAYDRKEAKEHGEGGLLVGSPVKGRVVIIDDVLTAGTAMRHSVRLLRQAGATPVAALIALDRQERGPAGVSAVAELEKDCDLKVFPLVTVRELLAYLENRSEAGDSAAAIVAYQSEYGVE